MAAEFKHVRLMAKVYTVANEPELNVGATGDCPKD
jgi:hypothetical protein